MTDYPNLGLVLSMVVYVTKMENIELSKRIIEVELRQVVIIQSLQEVSQMSNTDEWKLWGRVFNERINQLNKDLNNIEVNGF